MNKDNILFVLKRIKENWYKVLFFILLSLFVYGGWNKFSFFIPSDKTYTETNENGEDEAIPKNVLIFALSIGTASALFWFYYKQKRKIQYLENQNKADQYNGIIKARMLPAIEKDQNELMYRIRELTDNIYRPNKDVVLAVLLKRGRPEIFENHWLDGYINCAYEFKKILDSVLTEDLIKAYPRDIFYITFNFLDELMESYDARKYLYVDKVFYNLKDDNKPVVSLYKRALNIIYSPGCLSPRMIEKHWGKYEPQIEDFNLEEFALFLKNKMTKDYQ